MSERSPDAEVSMGRRLFVAGAAAGAVPMIMPSFARAAVGRDDTLTVGVIGCGGRGTGAARDALEAGRDVRSVALGDLFPDRLAQSRSNLTQFDAARATVADSNCFSGFDAYRGVLSTDCDIVILATPPGFRPDHFAAAIAAGKHVFTEKPVGVDGTGIRKVLAAGEEADRKGLCVVAGTQRRHENNYLAAMAKMHGGAIGDLVAGRCYWNMGGLWNVAPEASRSEMENQIRNWLYFPWLSGDHIVEQHVHNLDVLNWAFGAHPERVFGVGGRQARTGPDYGVIFDHFGLEYGYPDGRFALSMCRQQNGTPGKVEEIVTGTQGRMVMRPGFSRIDGGEAWRYTGPNNNPYVTEHEDLQRAIRSGNRVNETRNVAYSTLTAIMGRESANTGQEITWDQALNSSQDLMPAVLAFTECPTPPVPIPGKTKFF
ncbi:MAG: Gfo/Idh/MocA family protein [Phycisphaerales bacterium]